jgi:hypothetical protein
VQLVEPEREVANGRPDVAPLLVLEPVPTRNDRRERAEGDDIFGEQRASPLEVDRANARLHLEKEASGNIGDLRGRHAAAGYHPSHALVQHAASGTLVSAARSEDGLRGFTLMV